MPSFDADQLRRQLRAHLESLRGAGVEWSPVGKALMMQPPTPVAEVAQSLSTSKLTAAAGEPIAPSRPDERPVVQDHAPADGRRQELELLAKEVTQCTRCAGLASTRRQTVFGQGKVGPELCFVGEAPGGDEDKQGLAFVGEAGQMLTRILAACGLTRDEVYICNTIKCRPPGNRTPLPDELSNCRGFLQRQLELIQPKYLVALGGCAAGALLNTTLSLGRLRGRFHDYRGIPVWVTYHPSYLLPHRHPEKKREVWDDMQLLMTKIGREIPKRG